MATKLFIVVWRSYGDWRATCPFSSKAKAETHIDKILKPSQERSLALGDKHHYADIQVTEVEADGD